MSVGLSNVWPTTTHTQTAHALADTYIHMYTKLVMLKVENIVNNFEK